ILPVIERNQECDTTTGANCTNPPLGAEFYPIYTSGPVNGRCQWQLGGPFIPGSTNSFGGSSHAEYGSLLQLMYASKNGPALRFHDYRQLLSFNPCRVTGSQPAGKIIAASPIRLKKGPGQSIKAGSFRYKNTTDAVQRIGTIAVTVSNPTTFASLTVTASGQSATVAPVSASNA